MSDADVPNDGRFALQLWALSDAFERRLAAELAPLGLSVTAFRLVGELLQAPDGLRVGVLAERLGVKAPSVSGMLDRFEQQGLVERFADPVDARATRVRLSPRAPLAPGHEVLAQLDRLLLSGCSSHEQTTLAEQLSQLTTRLSLPTQESR